MSRKRFLVVGVGALVAVVAYFGYQRVVAGPAVAETFTETATVRRDELQVTVSATGSLVPDAELSLAFSQAGRVADVLVEEGQHVEEGQPLIVLETDDLQLQLAAAEGNLAAAQGGLDSAQASLAQVQAGSSEEDIEIARLGVDQTKDKLWSAQAQRDSTCGRVDQGRGEQAEGDAAQASVLQAEDAVRIAELQHAQAQAGPGDEDVAVAREKVNQAQGQVDTSGAQMDQAWLKLGQATLSGPISGTVASLDLAAGEWVGAGQSVLVLSDLSDLAVDISLDEIDVAEISIGQEARVIVDAFPDVELSGEVTAIAPVADTQSGVVIYPVEIGLAPVELPVRAGMPADVEIVVASQESALIVPLRAVTTVDGRSAVLRQSTDAGEVGPSDAPSRPPRDGQTEGEGGPARNTAAVGYEKVPVTLGIVTDTEVEITSGLSEGDVVAVVTTSAQTPTDERTPGMGMLFGAGGAGRK